MSKSAKYIISKHKLYPFKSNETFANEIRGDEENINNKIFREYPPSLTKNLFKDNKIKYSEI